MAEQENLAKIEKLTKKFAHMTSERNLHQILHLSLECKVKDLEKEIRMQKTTISNYDQHVKANDLKMLQLSERICELETTQPAPDATEREKELESELKISQQRRCELRMEFERIENLYADYQIRAYFFQIMFEYDTTEIKSLTVAQFEKKIQRFFKMLSELHPLDNQKRLDEDNRVWKLSMIYIHPDKNRNDPCANDKFSDY
jgi:hypothetical protein